MSALIILRSINRIIGILFLLCYSYQLLYVPVALLRRKRAKAAASAATRCSSPPETRRR